MGQVVSDGVEMHTYKSTQITTVSTHTLLHARIRHGKHMYAIIYSL